MKSNSVLKSFGYAFKGFKSALLERNFKIHLISTVAIVTLSFYCGISGSQWLAILLCIGIVLSLELMNTAIEEMVDILSPGFNEKAGKIKDLAAASVLVSSIVALIIALVIFLPYLQ